MIEPNGYTEINGLHLLLGVVAYSILETLGAAAALVVMA